MNMKVRKSEGTLEVNTESYRPDTRLTTSDARGAGAFVRAFVAPRMETVCHDAPVQSLKNRG